MKIPKAFKLGNKRWLVRELLRGGPVYGRAFPEHRVMHVVRFARTPAQRAETFWHEVTHAILHDMKHPQWDDEKFVKAFSKRLNEVVHTAELG